MNFLKKIFSKRQPRDLNLRDCAVEDQWNRYFVNAEKDMEVQWSQTIWPIIKDFNFDVTLELAPGAGRNTEKLAELANVIHAVDLNEYALAQVRTRFANRKVKAQLFFHKNDGCDLSMIETASITTIYCWDAAVHFERSVIEEYVKEFARILKPGGKGFFHHSNLGDRAHVKIKKNFGWRSNMSKELFRDYCAANGLKLLAQHDMPWGEVTDCISVFAA